MARPQHFNKKENEKKKLQKRQDKAQRKKDRQLNAVPDASWETMIAYVDENGNLTATPPDVTKKKAVDAAEIVTGSRNTGNAPSYKVRSGRVMFFNAKGYGFIKDDQDGNSVYVSSAMLLDPIKDNDKVSFEIDQGPRGKYAIKVKLQR